MSPAKEAVKQLQKRPEKYKISPRFPLPFLLLLDKDKANGASLIYCCDYKHPLFRKDSLLKGKFFNHNSTFSLSSPIVFLQKKIGNP